MEVKMLMLLFWVIRPCGIAGRYQCFGGTYFLYLQGITTQKTTIKKF
jgi:hypothetical protein